MKYFISLFFLFSVNAFAQQTYDIKCYHNVYDQDDDNYAKIGSPAVHFQVSYEQTYVCPKHFVSATGDCHDFDADIHPYRTEVAFNNIDDNCNNRVDETEYVYSKKGYKNTHTSIGARVKINKKEVLDLWHLKQELYARIRYRRLAETDDKLKTTPLIKVSLKRYYNLNLGMHWASPLRLDGLVGNTPYFLQARFYVKNDDGTYRRISDYGKILFYSTTTDPSNPVSLARTKILLQGFKQYFNQVQGLVGLNGSRWANGTHYGADLIEWWCSEFYSWVTQETLGGITNLSNVGQLRRYFDRDYHSVTTLGELKRAKRGDWLAIDTSGNGRANHTGMFLAIRSDDAIISLEGNTGNRIKVRSRNISQIVGFGHIMKSHLFP